MKKWKIVGVLAIALTMVVPIAASAATSLFEDVPDDSIYVADINWVSEAGVSMGCNPPLNTNYCPDDYVKREQMAAFLHRVAVNQVVDAGTVEGFTAAELQGQKGDTGPAGADGAAGPAGADSTVPGPVGPTGADGADAIGSVSFYNRSVTESLPAAGTSTTGFHAECDPGDFVTGGGHRIATSGSVTNSQMGSYGASEGWNISATIIQAGDVTVYARCMHVTTPAP